VRNEIGVMQGRLLPPVGDRIQAFPGARWPEEFETAAALGLDAVEFIFEGPRIVDHPLMRADGIATIRDVVGRTGVRVSAICADYFMDCPLFRSTAAERAHRCRTLERLARAAAAVGADCIEIPCVDQASLRSAADEAALVDALAAARPAADEAGVALALETDLPPERFRDLLERVPGGGVMANYDTGNSAALGYDPAREIPVLGDRIRNIHIKDRVRGGTTVPLGTGDADFEAVFAALAELGYTGPFILQTARDPDDVSAIRRYHRMVRDLVDTHLAPRPGEAAPWT
jgi:L-ribulose-5-phosphate 3-epimerase